MTAKGIIAPETSQIPVMNVIMHSEQQSPQAETTQVPNVLDHTARLDFEIDTQKGATLISF